MLPAYQPERARQLTAKEGSRNAKCKPTIQAGWVSLKGVSGHPELQPNKIMNRRNHDCMSRGNAIIPSVY